MGKATTSNRETNFPRCFVEKTCVPFPNHLQSNRSLPSQKHLGTAVHLALPHYFTGQQYLPFTTETIIGITYNKRQWCRTHNTVLSTDTHPNILISMLVVKLTHIPSQQVTSDIPNAEYGRWRQKRIPPFGSHSESKAKKKKKN